LIIAVAGFFIEAIGVNTGLIFGNYVYKTTLGWKFLETPLIIGVNGYYSLVQLFTVLKIK
jgi:putative membrane protein